jgi:hypothetical protein
VQDVAPDEPPKVFHTDCDVQTNLREAEDEGGGSGGGVVVAHPAVASVLYLSNVGGATAVFGQAKSNAASVLRPRLPVEVAVVGLCSCLIQLLTHSA